MKKLLFVAMVFAAACGDNKSSAPSKNLVIDVVTTVEENAKCTSLFQGEGTTKVHAAYCKLANKVIVFCSLDTAQGFRCAPLNAGPPADANAVGQPAQPPGQPGPQPAPPVTMQPSAGSASK